MAIFVFELGKGTEHLFISFWLDRALLRGQFLVKRGETRHFEDLQVQLSTGYSFRK